MLAPVGGHRLAHPAQQRVDADDAGERDVRAEEHHRRRQVVAQLARPLACPDPLHPVAGLVELDAERGVVHHHQPAVAHLRGHRRPVPVVHHHRGPGPRDERGSLHRRVGEHQRRVGVHAPHRAAVHAEQQDVPTVEHAGSGQHLGGQLDALPADPGEQHLAFGHRLGAAEGPQGERDGVGDVLEARRLVAGDGVLGAAHRQVVDRVRVASRVAARGRHRRAQRRHDLLALRRGRLGVALGEPRPVHRERSGVRGRLGVAGLLEHPLDPGRDLAGTGLGAGHPPLEAGDQAALPVLEDGEQQLVLAPEVPVEGLVRQPRGLHDVAHPRVQRPGAAHHRVRGVDEAAHLVGVHVGPLLEGPSRHRPLDGNDVLHSQNTIPVGEGRQPGAR